MNINININELKNLMQLAFDNGWSGYRDTRDDCINSIIEDYINRMPKVQQNEFGVITTTTTSESLKNTSDYYSYYTCSSGSNPLNINITDTF